MKKVMAYKYKLNLNKSQSNSLDSWIHTCRAIYNVALETKIYAYQSKRLKLSVYDLHKQLTQVRSEYDWVKDVPCQCQQLAISRLDQSFKSFFNGGGYPKFAKKGFYKSIHFRVFKCYQGYVELPKIGIVKYISSRAFQGTPKRIVITKEHNGFYVSIITEQSTPLIKRKDDNQVGIDVGIAHLTTLSNGVHVPNPRFINKYLKELRIEQRSLSRKKKGSKSREKQKRRLAKAYAKVRNSRQDYLHKVSTQLVKDYSFIAMEELNISGMIKNQNLSRSISDASWGELKRMIDYKSKWHGTELVSVDARYTSQTCNVCGSVDKESRISQSKFKCTNCGYEGNADVNAAMEILKRGRAMSLNR